MFGSGILDIVIGLVFVYLLLSLIASTLNELILAQLNMRGKYLLRGLKELLNDQGAAQLVKHLYEHGLVYGLFQGPFDPDKPSNLPSYIPARSFALAILDLIPRVVPSEEELKRDLPSGPPNPSPTNKETSAARVQIGSSKQEIKKSGALCSTGMPGIQTGPQSDTTELLKPFRDAVSQLADAKVREPLIAMIDAANNDATTLRRNLEEWYNSAMDRVSGWYKFRIQRILFCIGIILATLINADTLVIVRHLSNDATLRQSLVAEASEVAKQSLDSKRESVKAQTARIAGLSLPLGWVHRGAERLASESERAAQEEGLLQADREKRVLPVLDSLRWHSLSTYSGNWLWIATFHIGGWLLTALAISLGAPFWFDLLNRFIVVRSTVKPKEKSPEEKSKS